MKRFLRALSMLLVIAIIIGIVPNGSLYVFADDIEQIGVIPGFGEVVRPDSITSPSALPVQPQIPNTFLFRPQQRFVAQTGEFIVPVVDAVGLSVDLTPSYGNNGKFIAPIDLPEADSIPIFTRSDLENIRNNLNGKYHLVNDIDLSGVEWVPIGTFNGTFDGQGYVIRNLTITENAYEYNGLFGYAVSAVIKNIGLEDTNINLTSSSSIYAGGICGSGSASITTFRIN